MKKFPLFSIILFTAFLNSCETAHYRTVNTTDRGRTSNRKIQTSSTDQAETEYQALSRTYKSETAAVLTDLLNGSEGSPDTSIRIENKSRCNIVLTVSGTNYFKKIPIAADKIGSAMLPKNQNYTISGRVCNSVYQKTKFITGSYKITVSN